MPRTNLEFDRISETGLMGNIDTTAARFYPQFDFIEPEGKSCLKVIFTSKGSC